MLMTTKEMSKRIVVDMLGADHSCYRDDNGHPPKDVVEEAIFAPSVAVVVAVHVVGVERGQTPPFV